MKDKWLVIRKVLRTVAVTATPSLVVLHNRWIHWLMGGGYEPNSDGQWCAIVILTGAHACYALSVDALDRIEKGEK